MADSIQMLKYMIEFKCSLTSAQFVVGSVAVEVVTFTVLPFIPLFWIVSFLAFTRSTDTVSVFATDLCAIVHAAVCIQILCPDIIFATFTNPSNTSLIASSKSQERVFSVTVQHIYITSSTISNGSPECCQ